MHGHGTGPQIPDETLSPQLWPLGSEAWSYIVMLIATSTQGSYPFSTITKNIHTRTAAPACLYERQWPGIPVLGNRSQPVHSVMALGQALDWALGRALGRAPVC